jgi:hypothetical protein
LNDKPIVSASSVTSNEYKELYNHITFYDAMKYVSKWFITDSENLNSSDPLFLIFRLHTKKSTAYNMMAHTLNELFGYSSLLSNMIYIVPTNETLDNTKLSRLINKIIIIVDPTYADTRGFENSNLMNYTSLVTGTFSNRMFRESELLSEMDVNKSIGNSTDLSNNIHILYPNLQVNKNNYDFVTTGIFNKITFIGMNFQYYDIYLSDYNDIFTKSAILNK